MIVYFVRGFPIAFAAVALFIGWVWWHIGEPPTWSVFAPRSAVTVIEAEVRTEPVGNGTTRYVPFVEVAPAAAPDEAHQLRGLMPAFSSGTERQAEAAIAGYASGETRSARKIGNAYYANRTEMMDVIIAAIVTLIGLAALFIGIRINLPRKRR